MYLEGMMPEISYQEVLITCEACKVQKKFTVENYEQCLDIFKNYQCPNGCGRNLYSFLTLGRIKKRKSS